MNIETQRTLQADLVAHIEEQIVEPCCGLNLDAYRIAEAFTRAGSREFVRIVELMIAAETAWQMDMRTRAERGLIDLKIAQSLNGKMADQIADSEGVA